MFIGKQEIEKQEGNIVVFKDGQKEEYTTRQLEYVITDNEKSASELQNISANETVKDLLNILEQHNIRQGDLQFILQKLVLSYNNTFDELVAKLFTGKSEVSDIRILDIQRIKKNFNI